MGQGCSRSMPPAPLGAKVWVYTFWGVGSRERKQVTVTWPVTILVMGTSPIICGEYVVVPSLKKYSFFSVRWRCGGRGGCQYERHRLSLLREKALSCGGEQINVWMNGWASLFLAPSRCSDNPGSLMNCTTGNSRLNECMREWNENDQPQDPEATIILHN